MDTGGPLKYRDGYKYVTHEAWWVNVPAMAGHAFRIATLDARLLAKQDATGTLVVYSGYAWDGASGPTIDTPSTMRGSLVHDVLYQAMRLGQLPQECRPVADRILHDLCEQDGMTWVRANLWERAVRLFAAGSARRQSSAPMVAP